MIMLYNNIELPSFPDEIDITEYPYIWIRLDNTTPCWDLVCAKEIFYYNSSKNQMITNGYEKWYRLYLPTTITNDTKWTFYKSYSSGDYWNFDSKRIIKWSLFDVPKDSISSSEIWYKGSNPTSLIIGKYLIRSNNILYTVVNNVLTQLSDVQLTANVFNVHGFNDIPSWEILKELKDPNLLYWQNSDKPLPILKANVSATPPQQTIITNDIDISDKTITGIEKITAEYTGDPHVACSFDNGITWKLYNGVSWVVLSENETGMTMETLLFITTENWTQILQGLTSFKMRFTLSNKEDMVTNIIINFTN